MVTLPVQPTEIGALIVSAIAAWTSWKTDKIYNWLTFTAAAVGIGLNGIVYGMYTALVALVTWVAFAVVLSGIRLLAPYNPAFRIPFGTVKLLAAIATFLGAIKTGAIVVIFLIVSWVYWYAKFARLQREGASAAGKDMLPHGPIILMATVLSILFFRLTM